MINRFNSQKFGSALKKASGVFTKKNHPEWATKADVIKWVKKSRKDTDSTVTP